MSARMRRRITTAKREEIEAEQKILENTIVRPFETLAGLPISYNEPPNGHYEDILKNPLTIKDSAVLYNSLIRSRSTYVYHAPMFKLHWVKQTAYAKKLAEMDKEKQKEILNDRENKRRFAKATTNSLEARTRTPVLSPEVNARDVMSKLCESSITLGPHTMDIRIFIAKDSRSEKSRAISELSKVGGPTPGASNIGESISSSKNLEEGQTIEGSSATPKPSQPDSVSTPHPSEKIPENKCDLDSKNSQEPKKTDVKDEQPLGNTLSKENATSVGEKCEKSQLKKDSNSSASPKDSDNVVSAKSLNVNPDSVRISAGSKNEPENVKAGHLSTLSSVGDGKPVASNRETLLPPPSISPSVSSAPAHVMQRTENKVASTAPSLTPQVKATAEPVPNAPKIPSKMAPSPNVKPSPTNLQSIDNTIMISNLNAIAKIDLSLNDLMKEVASGKASEAQITRFKKYIERAKQMGPQPHHAELYFNRGLPLPPDFPRPYQARPVAEKKAPPKPKVFNPMKLTAFQERYLHNATLVFEFLENPNVRYIIPQDSICEVLKPELPIPQDAEPGTECNDILISHMWIHNIDEMEQYEKDCATYEMEMKKRKDEEEREKKDEEGEDITKPEDDLGGEKSRSKPEARSLRTKKKVPPQRKKKQPTPPEHPHVKYTAFSFTIHNIPSRFVPIFINSMKPLKEVQDRMAHFLKTGTRITSFYLWYQVDARLDESFAENLRNTAVLEEKKMTGFLPPVEPKKRKPRENKNPRVKRPKETSPTSDKTIIPNFSGESGPGAESPVNSNENTISEGSKPPYRDIDGLKDESRDEPIPIAKTESALTSQ